MTKLRRPAMLTLTAVLITAGVALAQDEVEPKASPDPAPADVRLEALAALVPPTLGGHPLADGLQLATGEELLTVMGPEEADAVLDLLGDQGKTTTDYAVATTVLTLDDGSLVVVQAHRVEDIDASRTIAGWLDVLSVSLDRPETTQGIVAGRGVTLLSDAALPQVPPLYLFSADDTVWMVLAADESLVEEAMEAVGADGAEEETAA